MGKATMQLRFLALKLFRKIALIMTTQTNLILTSLFNIYLCSTCLSAKQLAVLIFLSQQRELFEQL